MSPQSAPLGFTHDEARKTSLLKKTQKKIHISRWQNRSSCQTSFSKNCRKRLPGGAETASDMGVQVRKNSSTVFDGINNKTVEKGQILEIKETKGELMFEFRNFGGHGFELAAYNRYPEILATLH